MTEPDDFEAFFHEHLPLIEKLGAAVARRYGLRGDDAEEYLAEARTRLWADDYAVLRKWRRESKLSTYLAVVLTNFAHEYRIRRDGRWRPSAAALRLGQPAIRLEKLVYYHGMTLEEAGERLRTSGETTLSDRELAALLAALPVRTRPRRPDEPPEPPIEEIPGGETTDARILAGESAREWGAVVRALHAAIDRLAPPEQLVVRLHFLDGLTLAEVARVRGLEQKPLYRVKDNALRLLRRLLAEDGVDPERLGALLGEGPPADDEAPDGPTGKNGDARPSNVTWNPNQSDETGGATRAAFLRRRAE